MRNVFDQYSQNENRLTHAFASALHHDDALKIAFLTNFLRLSRPQAKKINLTVQAYPGSAPVDVAEAERRGIPDIWFYDDDGWCAVVECKLTASINSDQIKRHIRTAAKQFERVLPVLITAHPSPTKGADAAIHISWQQIYIWLKQMNPRSAWSRYASDYFEILEQQMIEAEKLTAGTITTFSGFPLSLNEAWSYGEAKRVLQLAMQELRKDVRLAKEMAVDPTLPGRGAITGKGGSAVWDYLRPRQSAYDTHLAIQIIYM